MQTELTLSVGGLPPLSARGCIQDLQPIPQGKCVRTLTGDLIFIGNPRHKYKTTVRCSDENVLATGGLNVGQDVTVGCIQRLCQKVPAHQEAVKVTLEREPVPGSVSVLAEDKKERLSFQVEGTSVRLAPYETDAFIFYAPLLHMRVLSFTLTTDEWKMKTSWTLEMEEI